MARYDVADDHTMDHADHLSAMTGAWTRLTGSMFKSAVAANTVALSAMGSAAAGDRSRGTGAESDSVAYETDDWEFHRSVDSRDEIGVGDTVTFEKTLSDEDVREFAHLSGDTNRLHLDDEFASKTRFEGRIVHGTLISGLISAALARLPGLTVYISQDLEFLSPVKIDDRIRAEVEVVEDLGDHRFRLTTVVENVGQERTVIDGEAVVFVDEFPDDE